MKRVLPRCLVVVVSGILIGVLSAAPALADERIPLTADPVPLPKGKYCEGFDVLITFQDFNQYIVQSTTAPDGTQTLHITGRARATVTNEDTGKSISFNISGPGTLIINPDGSFSGDLSGANLLYTARKDLKNFRRSRRSATRQVT